jgi:Tfp pilus assembly protein PilV
MSINSPQKPAAPACAKARCGWKHLGRSEEGFTIIEALVASMVLVVGLLTAAAILIVSDHAISSVRAREGAVTLARQITEDARSLDYSQISSSNIVSTLQAMPGLANTSSGSTWTIARGPTGNQVTYTVTASVSAFNDAHDSSGSTTDIKQVTITVRWTTFQGKNYSYTETTTLSAAGQDPGLIASNLALSSPSSGYSGTSTAPVITASTTTSLQFSVTAPTGTTAIVWTLNGGKESSWNGSAPSSGTTWTSSSWSLSSVSDGTYTIGAQAEDANGVDGPTVAIQVRLIRNVPSAPNVTGYGFNSNFMVNGSPTTEAEVQWSSNPELNVIGYQITSPTGSTCQTSTSAFSSTSCTNWWCSSATACVDLNSPATNASNRTYTVQALYYDVNNVLRTGTATNVLLASGTPSPPPQVPLVSLTAVTEPDDSAIITWIPPTGGTAVSFYRIYRDGANYASRYDTVPASSCSATCTYHDSNRTTSHSYYITAVSASMAESAATGPVSG